MDDGTRSFHWDDVLERLRRAAGPQRRVLRLLGVGGMAGVYLAEDLELGRRIAIKVMMPGLLSDPRSIRRFKWEAQAMARINHPGIVTIHAACEREGLHYLEMAYVPGRRLADVMRGGSRRLPIEIVFHWLAQIGSALAYAHRASIVHRDIKPSNVLLDAEGNAVVTDFGIAKLALENQLMTATIIGTPAYMSPEQCSGDPIRAAADQYAFGVVAYELLTGELPFHGRAASLMVAHLSQAPLPLKERRPDCPPAVAAAVDRMLAKSPGDRFPDMEAAIAALGVAPLGDFHVLRRELRALAMPRELRLEPAHLVLAPAGPSRRLAARVVGWNDVRSDPVNAVWRSSDDAVVRIDADGMVTAEQEGAAEITATFDDLSATVDVLVRTPCHLEVKQRSLRLMLHEKHALTAKVMDGEQRPIEIPVFWATSDAAVATVDEVGVVTAAGQGSCMIEARTGDISVAVAVNVVSAPAVVTAGHDSVRAVKGDARFPDGMRAPASGRREPGRALVWKLAAAVGGIGTIALAVQSALDTRSPAVGSSPDESNVAASDLGSDSTAARDPAAATSDIDLTQPAPNRSGALGDRSGRQSGADGPATLATRPDPPPDSGEPRLGADPVRDRPAAAREIMSALNDVMELLRNRSELTGSAGRDWQIAARPDLADFMQSPYETIRWTIENPRFDATTGEASVAVHITFVGTAITPAPPQPFTARVTRHEGPWRVLSMGPRGAPTGI